MIQFEDFKRCPKCDHADFKVVTSSLVSKVLPKGQKNLIPIETTKRYFCAKCDRELTHYDF